MKIDDLYFGVKRWDFNHKTFITANLFDSYRVLHSVARWKTMSASTRKQIDDPIRFCFGDTWGRVEWEFGISPVFEDVDPIKVDVFQMYVQTNADLLMKMVNEVSVASARNWLKKYSIYR